jgi:predicted neutral ceramidase superfamily lipid hydrolase
MDPYYILYVFARRTPLILVVLGGIIFAVVRWKRHPRVSLLTILGLAFFLMETTLFTFLTYAIVRWFLGGQVFSTVLYVVDDIAYAAVIILLVAAAFTGRSRPVKEKSEIVLANAA